MGSQRVGHNSTTFTSLHSHSYMTTGKTIALTTHKIIAELIPLSYLFILEKEINRKVCEDARK